MCSFPVLRPTLFPLKAHDEKASPRSVLVSPSARLAPRSAAAASEAAPGFGRSADGGGLEGGGWIG